MSTDSPLAVVLAECIIAAHKKETRGAAEAKPVRKVYVIDEKEAQTRGNDAAKAA